jgi:hypothetical protein
VVTWVVDVWLDFKFALLFGFWLEIFGGGCRRKFRVTWILVRRSPSIRFSRTPLFPLRNANLVSFMAHNLLFLAISDVSEGDMVYKLSTRLGW